MSSYACTALKAPCAPFATTPDPNCPMSFSSALAGHPLHFNLITLHARASLCAVSVDISSQRLSCLGLGSGDLVSPVYVGEHRKSSLTQDNGNGRTEDIR